MHQLFDHSPEAIVQYYNTCVGMETEIREDKASGGHQHSPRPPTQAV
jgi:hypothetical protein